MRAVTHEDEYFLHYLTSLFKEKEPLKLAQLIHVFQGRRTPSMLYIVEKHHLFSAFEHLPQLTRDQLKHCLDRLVERKWVRIEGEEYYLTSNGREHITNYFVSHSYPSAITSLQYAKARQPFWERFQLVSQVFSEKRYKNTDYSPVVKHPSHQDGVKIWLHEQGQELIEVTDQWIEEVTKVFEQLGDPCATFLALQLAGHGQTGQTRRQVAEAYNYTLYESSYYLENALEQMLQFIQKGDFPLLGSLLKDIQKETHRGLTASTYQTALYLTKGFSLQEIARERQLKVSTIHEHLLEIAFIQPHFSYEKYVPKKMYKELQEIFAQELWRPYREVKEMISDLPFLFYRLVQLERMRQYARKH